MIIFMIQTEFDFLVIGGGSGGVRAARRAASMGKKVALFEKSDMGGTCVLKGCIPKKLMWYGARFLEDKKLAGEYGWKTSPATIDWDFQKKRREIELKRLSQIYTKLLTDSHVHIIEHEACFKSPNTLIANGKLYTAPHILIATGGWPYKPDITGAKYALTSNEIFELPTLPQSLIVVGAGYIALEFAGIFQACGTKTTVLCRKGKVLTGFDNDVRTFYEKQAEQKGLSIVHHFEPVKIEKNIEKNTTQFLVYNSKKDVHSATHILFATGRTPLTQPLHLEKAKIQTKNGKILVSKNFETSSKGVYAIGDCADTPYALTPVALAEAEVLVKNLFAKGKGQMDYNNIPSAVFSNPNIAQVGLTEKQALNKGLKIQIFESSFRPLKYSIKPEKTEEKIYVKMIVEKKTDRVLGCHMVGGDSPEIIQGLAIALRAGARKKDFDRTIGLHPSSAEEFCTLRTSRN